MCRFQQQLRSEIVWVPLLMISVLVEAAPSSSPGVIEVTLPESSPPLERPDRVHVLPNGTTPFERTVEELAQVTHACLDSYHRGGSNQHWCQARNGCRRAFIDRLYRLASLERPENTSYLDSTLINLIDEIAYATISACPTTDDSCDIQADLVSAMIDAGAGHTTNRTLQCTPCVKKAFGRMLAKRPSNYKGLIGDFYCNKVDGQWCSLSDPDADQCSACNQRAAAKAMVFYEALQPDDPNVLDQDTILSLSGCYDDGHGRACMEHVQDVLRTSYGVRIPDISNSTTWQYGNLSVCLGESNGCANAECRSVLHDVVQAMGCCAPVLRMFNGALNVTECAVPMIESQGKIDGGVCLAPVKYYVEVTVVATESAKRICQAVSQDLATTLAVIPDLIRCERLPDRPDHQHRRLMTVRATILHHRAIGMPSRIPLDITMLQSPVISVVTRTSL